MQVIVNNMLTEYTDQGSGKVVLFLHGWGDNLHSFDHIAETLKNDYRVVSLDLPGFGKTEMVKDAWDLNKYIDFVNNFTKKLDLTVYALVGHSFGGRVIIKGTADGVLGGDKIILIGSAGIAQRKTFKNQIFKVVAKVGKIATLIPPLYFWRDALRKKMYSFVGTDYLNARPLRETFVKIVNEDLASSALKINKSALLIWGANDTETPLTDGKRLSGFIKNSRLEVIEGAGHFVHKERPLEVLKLIKQFLC